MSQSLSRPLSTRDRRPTNRYKDYDSKQGKMPMLSQSVGRLDTPPTTDPLAVERAINQEAIAAERGNTSLPGALKPLTAETRDSDEAGEEQDELVEDVDDEAEPPLLDYRLEDIQNEDDRVEWLVQTIEKLGARHNYRDDPSSRTSGPAPRSSATVPGQIQRIQTGVTHVVEPQTSGQSSRRKLVCTDHTTLGLDGMRIGAHVGDEYGKPPAPKLARTDKTTIGLDGRVVSPPRTLALNPRPPPDRASSSHRPVPVKRMHSDNSAPSKKWVKVPKTRFDALRKENAKLAAAAFSGHSSTSAVKPAKLVSRPVPTPSSMPVATPALKSVPTPISKPTAKAASKPATGAALKPAPKPIPKAAPKAVVKAAPKPALKATPNPAPKPALKPTPKPVPKLTPRSMLKAAPKPALETAPDAHRPTMSDVEMHDPPTDDNLPSAGDVMAQSFASTLKNGDDGILSDQREEASPEIVTAEQDAEDVEDGQGGEDYGDAQGALDEDAGVGEGTKRQQAQLRAFPPDAREVVSWVAERVKVDISTRCAFADCMTKTPGSSKTHYEDWLAEGWEEAQAEVREGMPRIALKDSHAAYIKSYFYTIRNLVKKAAEPLVSAHFGLRRRNANRVEKAKGLTVDGNECWLSPNKENDDEIFKNPIIAQLIEDVFFKTPNSFGYQHLEAFTPLVRLGTIAFVCAIIRHCILSYASENRKATKLNSTSDKDAFVLYMGMLEDIRQNNPPHLLDIRLTITEQYLEAWPQSTPLPVPKMNLNPNTTVDMARLEKVKNMLGENVPEIEEWDGVLDVRRNGKGKGAMRYGPSGSGH
ncbi:hypothetical protein RhiLY_06671 [Ceratobasidium sp. AG-Ba]|nr:hypothetical protein RhiLY_06671 [Ceratobasidium sp. AG-Ba]